MVREFLRLYLHGLGLEVVVARSCVSALYTLAIEDRETLSKASSSVRRLPEVSIHQKLDYQPDFA